MSFLFSFLMLLGFLKMGSSGFFSKETVSAFSFCSKRSIMLSNIRSASLSLRGEGRGRERERERDREREGGREGEWERENE